MIHEIGKELEARLRARGWGAAKVFDREQTKEAGAHRERVVLEEDGDDTFEAAKKNTNNPPMRFVCAVSCKCTIYGDASTKGGALDYEHRRRTRTLLARVLCAMEYVAAQRRNQFRVNTGHWVVPENTPDDAPRYGGAVYEFPFTFDRGVFDETADEIEISDATVAGESVAVTTTLDVSLPGED